ncbi:unnamed protein product, partial [Mycena citricolor]
MLIAFRRATSVDNIDGLTPNPKPQLQRLVHALIAHIRRDIYAFEEVRWRRIAETLPRYSSCALSTEDP